MAFKKKSNQKRYTSEQKIEYHSTRERAPGRFGLKFGGPKHCYSSGFTDAFIGRNNERGIKGEFGKHSSNAYALGHKRGMKAASEYLRRTGKQPFDLTMKKK